MSYEKNGELLSRSKSQPPKSRGKGQSQQEVKQSSFKEGHLFHLDNLISAVERKDVFLANRIISENSTAIKRSGEATLALHSAIELGLIEVAETLLNHNAFVRATNVILRYQGQPTSFTLPSAMEKAIESKQHSIMRLILQASVYDKTKDRSVSKDQSKLDKIEKQEKILARNELTSRQMFDRIDPENKEEDVPENKEEGASGKRKSVFGAAVSRAVEFGAAVSGAVKNKVSNSVVGKKQKLSFEEIKNFAFQKEEFIDYSHIDTREDKNKSFLLRFIQKLDGADVEEFYNKYSEKYKVKDKKNEEVEVEYVEPSETIKPFLSYKTLFTSDHRGRTPLSVAMERFLKTSDKAQDKAQKAGFLDIAVMLYNKMCEYDVVKAKEILKDLEGSLARNRVTILGEGGVPIETTISKHLAHQANMIFKHRMNEYGIDLGFLVGYYSSYEYKEAPKPSSKPKPKPTRQASSKHTHKKEHKSDYSPQGSDDQGLDPSDGEEQPGSRSTAKKASEKRQEELRRGASRQYSSEEEEKEDSQPRATKSSKERNEREEEPRKEAYRARSNKEKEGGSRKGRQEQSHEDHSSDEEKGERRNRSSSKPTDEPRRQASSEHTRKKQGKGHRATRLGSDDQGGYSGGEEEKEDSQLPAKKKSDKYSAPKQRQEKPRKEASRVLSKEDEEDRPIRKDQGQSHEVHSSDEDKGERSSRSSLKPKPKPTSQDISRHSREKEAKDHRATRLGSDDQERDPSDVEEQQDSQSRAKKNVVKSTAFKENKAGPRTLVVDSDDEVYDPKVYDPRKESKGQSHEGYSSEEDKEAPKPSLKPGSTRIIAPSSLHYIAPPVSTKPVSPAASSVSQPLEPQPVTTPPTAPAPALSIAGDSRGRSGPASHSRSLSAHPRVSSDVVRGNLVSVLPAGQAPGQRILRPGSSHTAQSRSQDDGPARG